VIVIAGEALIDLVAGDGAVLHAHPGGGPFNVARTIGRLERPVAYLGALSDDAFGERLRAQLAQDGVELSLVAATTLPTTLALAQIGADGSAGYRFYTAATSTTALTAPQALGALTRAPAMVLLGGLALVLDPVGGALEIAVEKLSPEVLVALDPNCRPAAVDDPDAYRARIHRILRRTDLVKASEEDLAYLFPDRSPLDSARQLLADARTAPGRRQDPAGATRGPSAVVVTRGAEGAIVMASTGAVTVPAPAVDVVDTIGAGDAFAGGLLAWWDEHGFGRAELSQLTLLTDAARSASLTAALTCTRAGASPPTRQELAAAGGW
jgi:fructokinase